ncbi:hypothetical protein EPUS_07166 [Endocarpon pusillum Z07020]|uniref:Protein rds1 n=1 Tax=Endocarpon pusillum (strain Z07020 / HMAS-L-300199) TaxID=1263415 RepID=U1HEW6_ENDPU|nr:uncharacterized protein EPUS_07166 [Endocarpon pusillum Z07020]ERF68605.1 hypothetical protein EPUS_07166 [Endocarpon pusillum Z07020]
MMLSSLLTALAAMTATVFSAPLASRALADLDLVVLQFALTLEHLENVFYKQALQKFTEKDFADAGFDKNYFNNLRFIAQDEEAHVVVLTQEILAAGAKPVESCEYNFGKALDDVKSFVSLGSVLEGVGVSAYSGSAPAIESKDLLTAAAAILVAEGLHQGIQRQGLQQVPSANIVGTPASPTAIFTLASAFIGNCPSTNMALPFTAFPTLTTPQTGAIAPNATAIFSVGGAVAEPFFMTFVSGIDTISVPGKNENGLLMAQIPAKTQGQTYAFVTKEAAIGAIRDSQVLFGPAILEVTADAPTFDLTIQ